MYLLVWEWETDERMGEDATFLSEYVNKQMYI